MRTNYIPALLATLLLAAPLWAGMQQSGRPSGGGAQYDQPSGGGGARPAFPARPQPAAPYAIPAQPQAARPRQFFRGGGEGPHHGDWLRHTMQLPPQEQQQRLEQDQHFRQLPQQRQEELRNRLQTFNAMSPQERQRVLNRMEMIERLPPEQQRRAEALFGQFRAMDPLRKDMVRHALRAMRTMPPDVRLHFLNSRETRALYPPQEIRMLYDFNSIGFVGP